MSVLVIGDTHCPGMRKGYVGFLQRVADKYGVNRVVHIGDLVDWGAISYHEKNPSCSNAELEYQKAKKQVQELVRAFPKADWMIGNHDALTERQAKSAGLPSSILKDYNEMWEVPWKVRPYLSKLKIGNTLYAHGDSGRGGQNAAISQALDNFRSTVIGHFHAAAGVWWRVNEEFRIFGMSVGCGVDRKLLQFEYGKKYPKKPILGCGIVDKDIAHFEPWLLKTR